MHSSVEEGTLQIRDHKTQIPDNWCIPVLTKGLIQATLNSVSSGGAAEGGQAAPGTGEAVVSRSCSRYSPPRTEL